MTKIELIEPQIESLTPEELAAFRQWFQTYDAARWDQQFDADVRAGKLEALRAEALAEQRVAPPTSQRSAPGGVTARGFSLSHRATAQYFAVRPNTIRRIAPATPFHLALSAQPNA